MNNITPKTAVMLWAIANQIMLKVGMVLDPIIIGIAPWGSKGVLPKLTILTMGNQGYWASGEITCACGNKRVIMPGDWMHVRKCTSCKPASTFGGNQNVEVLVTQAKQAEVLANMAQALEALGARLAALQGPTAPTPVVEGKPEVKQ